jgi:hypothetical protein
MDTWTPCIREEIGVADVTAFLRSRPTVVGLEAPRMAKGSLAEDRLGPG